MNIKSPDGLTPLHFACQYGSIEMVQLLIKHTPTFDANSRTNDEGNTIFHYAVNNYNTQVLKLILDTYQFENIRSELGYTILHDAVGHGSKETIEFLIDSRQKFGLNIEETTNCRRTILHIACLYRDMEIVDLVHNALEGLNSDIDFDTPDEIQVTPFHFAFWNSNSNVAICLLQRFPDKINEVLPDGDHALHWACVSGNLDLLKYIFGNPDFDVNIVDPNGKTPLHFACLCGRFKVVKFLLNNEKGIDTYKKDNDLRTAEDCARQEGHTDIVELFKMWTLPKKIEAYKSRLETLKKKCQHT